MAEIINESELENVSGGAYSGACFYYKIQKGDCLSLIAQRYGTTVDTLAQINKIKDPDLIYAGGRLLVPYKG